MKVSSCDLEATREEVTRVISRIREYVPGYNLVVAPHFSIPNVVTGTVKVTGAGYVLPEYAGNLDIINAAAVETARRHSEFYEKAESLRK
jgi:acetaldehyde dehydrogenase